MRRGLFYLRQRAERWALLMFIDQATILGSYIQLDYGIQFTYSETREDGAVRVVVERPVDFGVYHVEPSACG